MEQELRKRIRKSIELDSKRDNSHQTNLMLRLTTEQLGYLTEYLRNSHIRPGTYIRRLLVIEMEKRKFRKEIKNEQS